MCKLKIAIYVICVKYSLHFTKMLLYFISRSFHQGVKSLYHTAVKTGRHRPRADWRNVLFHPTRCLIRLCNNPGFPLPKGKNKRTRHRGKRVRAFRVS